MPGTANYLLGSDEKSWHSGIPTYGRVAYRDLYPGIDLEYYGTQRQLESDWVVAPRADPRAIALSIDGARGQRLDGRGNLVLPTGIGDVLQSHPVAYQEVDGRRQDIAASYALSGTDGIAFTVGSYDTSKPLVIDPVLSYSTYLGGSGSDEGLGVAVNGTGNAYVTGSTSSTTFPTTTGAFSTTNVGGNDVVTVKLNAQGTARVYSTYLGGSGDDVGPNSVGQGIAVDRAGNAYLTGDTFSADFPTTANAYQRGYAGGSVYGGDAFVTRLNAAGSGLVYSTYLGGSGPDYGHGIAVDCTGNVYLTGHTDSANFPTTPGALQSTSQGHGDAFVVRIDTTASGAASLVYGTLIGRYWYDGGSGIAVDSAGDAYEEKQTMYENVHSLVSVLV